MTQEELMSARRYVLIADGLMFCSTGELKEHTRRNFEHARKRWGDDFLVEVKNGVEKLYKGSHPERLGELWSF